MFQPVELSKGARKRFRVSKVSISEAEVLLKRHIPDGTIYSKECACILAQLPENSLYSLYQWWLGQSKKTRNERSWFQEKLNKEIGLRKEEGNQISSGTLSSSLSKRFFPTKDKKGDDVYHSPWKIMPGSFESGKR